MLASKAARLVWIAALLGLEPARMVRQAAPLAVKAAGQLWQVRRVVQSAAVLGSHATALWGNTRYR